MGVREIIFRGKRADNGEWIEGYLLNHEQKYYICNNCSDISYGDNSNRIRFGCWYEVLPETVGQYTGLTDKNGNKIFEGDILMSPIGRKAIVSFGTYKPWSTKDSDDFECWKLTLIANNAGETKLECGLGKHCMEYMRPIGNIYDNPELVRGEEE